MSDKISGFVVTFSDSVSDNYMDKVKTAILLIDGVAKVDPVVEDINTFLGQSKERYRIISNLLDFIKLDFTPKV